MRATSIRLLAAVGLGAFSAAAANAGDFRPPFGMGPFPFSHRGLFGPTHRHFHRDGRRLFDFSGVAIPAPENNVTTPVFVSVYVPVTVAAPAPDPVNPGPKIVVVRATHLKHRPGDLPTIVYGSGPNAL